MLEATLCRCIHVRGYTMQVHTCTCCPCVCTLHLLSKTAPWSNVTTPSLLDTHCLETGLKCVIVTVKNYWYFEFKDSTQIKRDFTQCGKLTCGND